MTDRGPQPFSRRQYKQQRNQFLIRNRPLVLALVVFTAAIVTLQALVAEGYWLGVAQGVFVTAMAAMLTRQFWAHTGALNSLVGGWGEEETRDQLRTATRSKHIYGWVDSITLGTTDIDHLVATPTGWYALDSKWHSRPLNPMTYDRDAYSATFAAGKAKSVLRHHRTVAEVRRVVVVWGRAATTLPTTGQTHGPVTFVPGRHLINWLQQQAGHQPLPHDQAHQLLTQLRSFRDDYLTTPTR